MGGNTIDCPKCGHEHDPSHEIDQEEMECDECGFEFFIETEYVPTFTVECKEHKFGPFKIIKSFGHSIDCRFCEYCGKCELKNEGELHERL